MLTISYKIPRLLAIGLFLGLLAAPASSRAAGVSVKPVSLRCEYLPEPLGLEVASPRLSWKLDATDAHGRGQRQTAYHLLVASDPKLLRADRGDLLDSGEVASDQSVNVACHGAALTPGQTCFWKVKVADEHGVWSSWSTPARWTMGLLNPADWQAHWIGASNAMLAAREREHYGNPPDPWFRKTFDLPAVPAQAVAYVASVGYHELYVNGQKVGDAVLEPAVTDYCVRARYVTYEIGKYLHPGRNVVGVWLGTSWSIFPPYLTPDKPCGPMLLAQLELQWPDGRKQTLVSDSSWKTHESPNRLLGIWDAEHFGGEEYDARREIPGWCEARFDDQAWVAAEEYHPKLVLSAEVARPNRRQTELRPVAIRAAGNGTWRVDMGTNYSGWFEMQLSGQPGDRVEFQFSERAEEPMTHELHSVYIIGPSGQGVFRNRFNYEVGQWIQISGLRQKPAAAGMRGWLIRTDYQRIGEFTCDRPGFNRLYETALWTFENLSLGNYVVDCPQRERRGYGGDAHSTIGTALDNYDLGAFYTKWIQDWRDVQQPDGGLPFTAPTYTGGGGPGWSGFCITLPWEIYRCYGDQRILEENFPMMQRWLAFVETKATNNVLEPWGGNWDFLGDWLWPHASGGPDHSNQDLFFNNCYWLYAMQTTASIADVLGQTEAAAQLRQRAETARTAIHQRFFNPADHSYADGTQVYLAFALAVNLPPPELRPAVWQRLEKQILVTDRGHIHAGITGGAFLFKTLLAEKRNDLLCSMVSQPDYPGWGDMLNRGATTLYEDWGYRGSRLHSSYLYVGRWFTEGLGGIRNEDGSGYKHFVIEPWLDSRSGVHEAAADYDSMYGKISSHWSLKSDGVKLWVAVPPNSDAIVRLDAVAPGSVLERGRALDRVAGVSAIQPGAAAVTFKLEPGQYQFTARPAH